MLREAKIHSCRSRSAICGAIAKNGGSSERSASIGSVFVHCSLPAFVDVRKGDKPRPLQRHHFVALCIGTTMAPEPPVTYFAQASISLRRFSSASDRR